MKSCSKKAFAGWSGKIVGWAKKIATRPMKYGWRKCGRRGGKEKLRKEEEEEEWSKKDEEKVDEESSE